MGGTIGALSKAAPASGPVNVDDADVQDATAQTPKVTRKPNPLMQGLGDGIAKGTATYQQQQDALSRAARPTPITVQQTPDVMGMMPRRRMDPNGDLFYGGY